MHPRDFLTTEHPVLARPNNNGGGGDARLSLRWLGTAGYEISAGGTTLLIDPYLTRAGLGSLLTRRLGPNMDAIDGAITQADAVFVGHSHFDHVLDVPAIAVKTGATVYGSKSTANLMHAAGVAPSQIHTLDHHRISDVEVGPFRITTVPSEHSPFLGGKVPLPGDIPCSCELPVRGRHYRCGDVFSFIIHFEGRTLYHMGSAALVDDIIPAPKGGHYDVLLMCIAARHATENFMARALRATTPRVVIPMHYDNFLRPYDKTMRLLPKTRFGRFVDDVTAFDTDISIATIGLMETLGIT